MSKIMYENMLLEVHIYSSQIKKSAISLRNSGLTYDEIAARLSISKGTLSLWLRDCPFPSGSTIESKRLYFIRNVQKKGAEANRLKKAMMWEALQKEATLLVKAIQNNDLNFLMSLLSILYWAEGTKHDKGGLVFTNTDPKLAKLFLELLRKTCEIDESRLRIRLHLHYYHKKTDTINFWSDLLQIPKEQFQSTYIKKRSRGKSYRKNFMGICFIKYGDTKTRRKILSYAYALGEHIVP